MILDVINNLMKFEHAISLNSYIDTLIYGACWAIYCFILKFSFDTDAISVRLGEKVTRNFVMKTAPDTQWKFVCIEGSLFWNKNRIYLSQWHNGF